MASYNRDLDKIAKKHKGRTVLSFTEFVLGNYKSMDNYFIDLL